MPVPSTCCNTCDPSTVVEVPGVQGDDGADGSAGVNAFTVTVTTTWNVPVVGSNTASLAFGSTLWMVIGQYIYVQGAGIFTVISKADGTHAVLQYVNYTGNTATGNPIVAGAQVSPSGSQAPPATVAAGSPEGVVTAPVGEMYVNSTTNDFWYKKTGTGNTGWVQLIG